MRRLATYAAISLLITFCTTFANALTFTKMAENLDQPWAIGFLPDGSFLITERDGKLLRVHNGKPHQVLGVPKVAAIGQGGLLDVLVPRDFSQTRQLFFTYANPQGGGKRAGTAVARATLSSNDRKLQGWTKIFELTKGSTGGRHFGSRLVEGRDNMLYATIGDRGDRPSAQDLNNENGTVIRIHKNGSIPPGNPLLNKNKPAIWSYGHRNPQGAALGLDGAIWVAEHGAKGGDEVNRIKKGANFGWPLISYGVHYSGQKIGLGTHAEGMEQPKFFWDPSMAPSGMMIYSGKLWPDWRGHIFVGSLKFNYIARLAGNPLKEVAQIKSAQTGRIRDVREAPDGAIWFISIDDAAVYRITP